MAARLSTRTESLLQPNDTELSSALPVGRFRVGTSGFSFDDWLGRAYPAGLAKAKMLEYYENVLGFDTVELNFTYYAMPVPKTLASMVNRTSPGFGFVVRSHKDMTHDIWQDDDRRVLKDTGEVFKMFREGISPLVDAGRLGCVLVQFPVFFYPVPQNFEYLRKMPALMPGVSIVVEFRNRAWLRQDAFRLLEETGMGCLCGGRAEDIPADAVRAAPDVGNRLFPFPWPEPELVQLFPGGKVQLPLFQGGTQRVHPAPAQREHRRKGDLHLFQQLPRRGRGKERPDDEADAGADGGPDAVADPSGQGLSAWE